MSQRKKGHPSEVMSLGHMNCYLIKKRSYKNIEFDYNV
jgi:hypothetical protein